MLLISLFELNFLKKILTPIFLVLLITLFLVLFFGVEVKGSKRWLDFFFLDFSL